MDIFISFVNLININFIIVIDLFILILQNSIKFIII